MKTFRHVTCYILLCSAAVCASPDAAPNPLGSDYKIAVRDSIQFQIYNQVDVTTVERVTSSGEIRLPLIGTVKVVDLTLREAERRLESLYRGGGFYVNPQVILSVEQYDDRFVAVLGQVKDPARIPMDAETTTIGILHAITEVGGFTRVAQTKAVQILRKGPDGKDQRITINTDDYLLPTATQTDEFQLHPGDIVFVPERVF
jgi:polysaccharide export outer membrane protein